MRTLIGKSILIVALIALINPPLVLAQVFKVETTGYEYCDGNPTRTNLNAPTTSICGSKFCRPSSLMIFTKIRLPRLPYR